jgi:phosphatidylserine/phosphatidylglycerophosphate/cardiolipin synthase-like enzyme
LKNNAAIDRGVKVELITSAKRDQPVYKYIKNGLLLRRLIRKGVNVYESHEKILHAKAYIFDSKIMTVGSFNNDRWSWRISNEVNMSIHSEQECAKAKPYFDDLKVRCHLVNADIKIGSIRRWRLMFWERFLYLSEVMMSKTAKFSFGSFWRRSPMSKPS